jgi:MYXO-CTERM domain-containing protein
MRSAAATCVVLALWAVPAAAAPAFVQENCKQNTGAVNSASTTLATATPVGNLLVLVVGWNSSTATITSVVDNVGNTYVPAFAYVHNGAATFPQNIQTFYASNIAAGQVSVTVTLNMNTPALGGAIEVMLHEYSGIAASTPLVATKTGSSTTPNAGPIATLRPNAVYVAHTMHTNTVLGVNAPFTVRGACGDKSADYIAPSAGMNTVTFTANTSAQWTASLVAFEVPALANGQPCAMPSDCTSDFCADGVCCDTACGQSSAGDCQSCKGSLTGGADGACGTILGAVGYQCRSAAGNCDIPETCTGASIACPVDAFQPPTLVCRGAVDLCDIAENCSGSSAACPADQIQPVGHQCRPSAGICDVAESCDGVSTACPADQFVPNTVQCRPMADVCDVGENCTGTSAACPADQFAPSTLLCRAAADVCDDAETCTGTSAACPADLFQPSTFTCRNAQGICDVAELCTGASPSCPVDQYQPGTQQCRPSAGLCDVAESCTGTGPLCPPDMFQPSTQQCRAAAGVCDVAESCTGASAACPADTFQPTTQVCRPAAGVCDAAERCTGSSASCPADMSAPDGTACPDGVFCNGTESCVSGLCSPGMAVVCTDPFMEQVLFCDEDAGMCEPVANSPPLIKHNALPTAGLGLPYAFNADGRVDATGSRPMTYGTCGGPAGFIVEPLTGAVTWTPAGLDAGTLCVSATNANGSDQYSFTVQISAPSGVGPVASFTATPDTLAPGLHVAFDGGASTADPSTPLVEYRWDFGMGGVPANGVGVIQSYLVSAGYQPELTVVDAVGRTDATKRPVRVLSADGGMPPSARIVASAVSGADSLSVSFHCDCQEGSAPVVQLLWWFGDGTSTDLTPTHVFAPGRYRVRLTAIDGAGLFATDAAEIVVTHGGVEPPSCRLFAGPPQAAAPFQSDVRAVFGSANGIASDEITLPDGGGVPGPELALDVPAPGVESLQLTVRDTQQLPCYDGVDVWGVGPGRSGATHVVVASPLTASCGSPFQYTPAAIGARPLAWTLLAGPGGTVDPSSGQLQWVPSAEDVGTQTFQLHADGPDGPADARVDVEVTCSGQRKLVAGCSCEAGPGGLALLLVLLGLARRRR